MDRFSLTQAIQPKTTGAQTPASGYWILTSGERGPAAANLIGALSTQSEDFRKRWAAHNVQIHNTGVKLIHHPIVGDLDLPFEFFPLVADLSQSLLAYTAEPGSPSQDGLGLLASWNATTKGVERAESTEA